MMIMMKRTIALSLAAGALVALSLATAGTASAARPDQMPGPGKVCYQDPGRGMVCEPAKK